MFKIPKAIKEINKIQEKLSKQKKITDKDFVEKTKHAAELIKQKRVLTLR